MTPLEAALAAGGREMETPLQAALAAGGVEVEEAQREPASPVRTFALNATNVFGAAPALSGALRYLTEGTPYAQGRDEYRQQIAEANEENPKAALAGKLTSIVPETVIGGGVGKAVSAGAKAAGVGASLAPWAAANPIMTKVLGGAASGAAYGAATGAGTATSEGKDILPAAAEGATVGGLLGGAVGGLFAAGGKLAKGASERALKNMKPAEAEAAIKEIGERLVPLREVVDKAGGVSIRAFSNAADDAIKALHGKPFQEQAIKGIQDARQSVLNAWAPDVAAALEATAGAKGIPGLGADAIRNNLTKRLENVRVPIKDFSAAIDDAAQISGKSGEHVRSLLRTVAEGHLDDAAKKGGPEVKKAVEEIRRLATDEAKLAEIAGKPFQEHAKGGVLSLFTHHGPLGAALALASGHPAAAAALAAPAVLKRADAFTARIMREAARGNPRALKAVEAAKAAQKVGTAGAATAGTVKAQSLSNQEATQ